MKDLVISDLDGTLLDDSRHVTAFTRAVIDELNRSSHVLFTIATARSWTTARPLVAPMGVHPMILHDGAAVIDPVTERFLFLRTIPEPDTTKVIDKFREHNMSPMIHIINRDHERVAWVSQSSSSEILRFWAERPNDPRRAPVSTWNDLPTCNVICITAIGTLESAARIASELATHPGITTNVRPGTYNRDCTWVEIMAADVNKARTAIHLKHLLTADRIIAFGDGSNDDELLNVADVSYAMSTAPPNTKAQSGWVLDAGVGDAVAKELLRLYGLIAPETVTSL